MWGFVRKKTAWSDWRGQQTIGSGTQCFTALHCGRSMQLPLNVDMLITESHKDVPTTADGKGSMR